MNWDAAGPIGEIIGAGAVVATLAFLAVQIRHSQRAQRDANVLARSAAVDSSFNQFTEFRVLIAADPEVARIWIAGRAGENLEEIEAEQFRQLALDYLMQYTLWQQRAIAVKLPGMADTAAAMIKEELDLHPGLRPTRDWLTSRGIARRTDDGSPS